MMKRYCLYLFILIGISCSAELKAQKKWNCLQWE